MRFFLCWAVLICGCATDSDTSSSYGTQPPTVPPSETGLDFDISLDSALSVDMSPVDGLDHDLESHDASEAADASRDLGVGETFDAEVAEVSDMSGVGDQFQQANEANPCEGRMDNHLLQEGTMGVCLYADPCVETGTANRSDLICIDGQAVEDTVSSVCERRTEGVLVEEGTYGACVYVDECADSGRRIKLDLVCEVGAVTEIERVDTLGCARVPNQSCGVVECVTHSQCDVDEFCVCPGYWLDIDGEQSCSDFEFEPRVCLPCAGLSGPVCMFDGLPESGITYPSLCDAPRFPPYLLSSACPPECDSSSPVSTCPNSQDFCTAEGRCEPR